MPYGKFKMGRDEKIPAPDGPQKRPAPGGKQKPNPKPTKPGKPGRIGIDDWRKINKPKRGK